jgi:hypothetical protein
MTTKAVPLAVGMLLFVPAIAQQNKHPDALTKVNDAAFRITSVISVFQPYLLKARELFFDARQLGRDAKQSAKAALSGNGATDNPGGAYANNGNGQDGNDQAGSAASQAGAPENPGDNGANNSPPPDNAAPAQDGPAGNGTADSPQSYLPNQNLPVNNPATVNNDGTGNWGNQNNALYGNFLDVLTGTIMGAGEAESAPQNVDVIFVAANGSYQLWTPDYARNEVAAQYTSASTYEAASKWNEVNETEIAETRVTLGQFDQIQNNSQILNVVKNAQNYDSSITEFGRLDGKVFAVKAELENRTVYGLIAVVKQVGTSGSNGYLKIKIKAQGVTNGQDDQPTAAAYQR